MYIRFGLLVNQTSYFSSIGLFTFRPIFFELLKFGLSILNSQGSPLGYSQTPKTNYELNLNEFSTTSEISDLKVSLNGTYEDLKICL